MVPCRHWNSQLGWQVHLQPRLQNKNEQKITVYGLNEESKLFYCGRTGLTDNTGWSHTIFDGDIYSKEIAARKLMYSPLGLIAPFAKTLRQRQQAGKRWRRLEEVLSLPQESSVGATSVWLDTTRFLLVLTFRRGACFLTMVAMMAGGKV